MKIARECASVNTPGVGTQGDTVIPVGEGVVAGSTSAHDISLVKGSAKNAMSATQGLAKDVAFIDDIHEPCACAGCNRSVDNVVFPTAETPNSTTNSPPLDTDDHVIDDHAIDDHAIDGHAIDGHAAGVPCHE